MKKVSNTEAELKKSVVYKKNVYSILTEENGLNRLNEIGL